MKTKLFALLLLVSSAVSAGGYRHSFGITFGTVNGLSYKGYVSNNLHFVLQVDAYWQMGLTTDWLLISTYTTGERRSYDERVVTSTMSGTEYQSAMINPSFMYQGKIGRWNLGNMYWFAGAGVGVGAIWGGEFDNAALWCKPTSAARPWFKMVEHLMMGVEFSFNGAPLVLGIELRPGMGQTLMTSGGDLYDGFKAMGGLMFDWGANFSLRYCFGEERVSKSKKTAGNDTF